MKKVNDYLNNLKIRDDETVVVGVSTGVDSMVLFYLLYELTKIKGFRLVCAHVNHKVRIESDLEEEYLKNLCKSLDIDFEVIHLEKITGNFQSVAREKRYEFFESIVNKYNASYLFLGHHGDDLIETVLMKLTRGVSLNNSIGILMNQEKDNYTILRPLLFLKKQEVYDYARLNNIKYFDDYTNEEDTYTRNRFRKEIVNFLHEENNNVHLKYLGFMEELEETKKFIDNIIVNYVDKYFDDSKLLISVKDEDDFLKKRLIEKFLELNIKDLSNITSQHTEILINGLDINKHYVEFNFPDNNTIVKDYKYLRLKEYNQPLKPVELTEGLEYGGLIFSYNDKDITNNFAAFLSLEDIRLPLYVRSVSADDLICLDKVGHQRVYQTLSDLKIPKDQYEKVLVIVDSKGLVLLIPGIKKSKYALNKKEKCDIIIQCEKEGFYND